MTNRYPAAETTRSLADDAATRSELAGSDLGRVPGRDPRSAIRDPRIVTGHAAATGSGQKLEPRNPRLTP